MQLMNKKIYTGFSRINDLKPKEQTTRFFWAGDAWLQSLQVILNNRLEIGMGNIYVIPPIMVFCLELYVKAFAAFKDPFFEGKQFLHKITKILSVYSDKIPYFEKIKNDEMSFKLIQEYEKTIDTKFGQTNVKIDKDEQNKMLFIIYDLRNEYCKICGLIK
jgi:hypothetical protein